MSIYKSQFTGAEIEEALNKAKLIEQDSNGFYKVDSNEDEPADLDDLIGLGNYTIYYFMNGHADWRFVRPINITVCLIDDILTQVVILVDKIYSRKLINEQWLEWSFASLSTSFFISDREPVEKELNNVWIDTSNPEVFSMYISNGIKFIPVKPIGMMSKDIYDTEGKNTDIFKYADEKTMEIISKNGGLNIYDILTAHENNTDMHVSNAERDEWNAKETPENATIKINQALEDLKSYSDTSNSGFSTTIAALAAEITAVAGLLTAHKENSAIHVTAAKEAYWNAKSEANHMHNLDGRVKVSASNVVGGVFDISQIPDGAKETIVEVANDIERFKLTIDDVQNGDMVSVLDSTTEHGTTEPTPALYIVIDETNLNKASGYREVTYGSNRSARWENVIERPTTLMGYGITDAFSKTEITNLHDELHEIILDETDVKIADLEIPVLETSIETHILNKDIHTSTAEKAVWTNKADGNHTHLNDGRVTVSAANVVGTIPLDRIPKGAIEEIIFVRDNAERFALTVDKAQKGDLVSVGGTFIPRNIAISANVSEVIYYNNNVYLVRGTEFIFPGNTIVQIPSSSRIRFKFVNEIIFLILDAVIYKVNTTAKTLEVVCQNSTSVPDIEYWNSKYYVYYNKGLWVGTGTTVASMTQIANISFNEMILVVNDTIFAMITATKLYRLQADHTYTDSGNLTFAPKQAFFFDGKFVIYGASKMATYNSVAITESAYTITVPSTFKIVRRGSYLLMFNNTNEMFISRDGTTWKRNAFKVGNNVNSVYQQGSLYFIPSSTGLIQYEFNSTIFDPSTVYYIIDETQLNNENGYSIYSIGTAESVKWSNITGKPTTVGGYGITDVYTKTETDTIMQNSVNAANTKMEAIKAEVNTTLQPANTKLNAHIADSALHTTPEKIAKWDGKAEGNHTHKAGDGTVELDGSQVTGGTIDLARLPKDALERVIRVLNDKERFALTKNEAQNGDTIVVEDAGYEIESSFIGVTAEDILMSYGGGYYVAIPTKGYYGAYSEDLINWTQFDIISNPTAVYEWSHIIFYNVSFLLFRKNFNAYYKIDIHNFTQTREWSISNSPSNYFEDLFKGENNTLCAISGTNEIYEFPNMDLTKTPTKYTLFSTNNPLAKLVETGYYVDSSNYYLYFSKDDLSIHICDGIDSEIKVFGPLQTGSVFSSSGHLCKFCEAGGAIFAITTKGIWTSKDGGYTWSQNTANKPPVDLDFCEIVHGNVSSTGQSVTFGGLFVTVGVDISGGANSYIASSTDGLTWQYQVVSSKLLTTVCYGHQKFVMTQRTTGNPTKIYWSWNGQELFECDLNSTAIPGIGLAPRKMIFDDNCFIGLCTFGIIISGDGLLWSSAAHPNMNYPSSMLVTKDGVFLASSAVGVVNITQIYRTSAVTITPISIASTLGTTTFKAVGLAMDNVTGLNAVVAMASRTEYFIYITGNSSTITKSSNTFATLFGVTVDPADILTIQTKTGKKLAILTVSSLILANFSISASSQYIPNGIETSFIKQLQNTGDSFIKLAQSMITASGSSYRPLYVLNYRAYVYYGIVSDTEAWTKINIPADISGNGLKNMVFGVNRTTGELQGMVVAGTTAYSQYFTLNSINAVYAVNVPTSIPGTQVYNLNGYFVSVQSKSSSFIYSANLENFNMIDIEFYDKFQLLDTSGTYIPSFVDNKYIICGHNSSRYSILDNTKNSKLRSMHFERIHNGGRQISKCNDRYIKPLDSNAIVSTKDGLHWRDISIGLTTVTQQTSIYAFGYYFVAGYNTTIFYSKDGESWMSYKMPLTLPMNCYNSMTLFRNKLYMTTSITGTSVNYILCSEDGFNWKQITLSVSLPWFCMVSGNGILAITADYPSNGFMYTTNGDEWTYVTTESVIKQVGLTYDAAQNIHTACFCAGTFFFPTYLGYNVYMTTDFITWKYIRLPVVDRWQCISNDVDEVVFTGRAYIIRLKLKNTKIYIVEDDTNLNNEAGYLDYSVSPASGPFYWENISNTPSDISGYGIADAYTKTEVDNKISAVEGDIGKDISAMIATSESQLRANLENNTSQLTTIKSAIAVIEVASASVTDTKNKLTTYSANIDSIYNAIKESEIILTNIDTIL